MYKSSQRVLIVAPPDKQSGFAEFLESEGFRCATAAGPRSAVAYCAEQGVDLVVVMDSPRDYDALATLSELKQRAPGGLFLPAILLLDISDHERRVAALLRGADVLVAADVSHTELALHVGLLLSHRSAQTELAQANAKLLELQDKKRILAALVVHDLRNPLSALHGNVELLREELREHDVGEMAMDILGDCRDVSTKALSLVAGILDVEELEEGLLEAVCTPTPVVELIQQAGRHHLTTVQARKLTLDYSADEAIRASVDADLTGRMIENLLDNAVRYAPYKGRVHVSAEADGDDLVIRVGNDGPAVPESERTQIFGRYYRIEARRAGARANRGLGLYFCRLVADAHGGTIDVRETAELPACFETRFPGAVVSS